MVAALPWIAKDRALDFPPFLLSLGTGWFAGAAINSRILRISSFPLRLIAAVAVIAVSAGTFAFLYKWHGIEAIRAVAPDWVKGMIGFMSMAAVVGCAWMGRVWLSIWIFGSERSRGPRD